MSMSKIAAVLSPQDAHYKAQAEHYLTEANKILRNLAAERQRAARRRRPQSNLVEEVKEILYGK
jgi:hypothetical protein